VGGDVLFDNGVAISPGSNIELGGLSEPGIVELNADGTLTFPSNIQQSNIILTNESQINVRADGGGNVNINAGNFGVGNGSIIRAGIDAGLGSPEAQGGDVNINARNTVSLSEGSFISNVISTDSIGKPGEININTNSLLIENGAILSTTTLGNGNAGNVTIQASESVQLIGGDIFSSVGETGIGNGGTVEVNTAQLELRNGGQILANTTGIGNAGNILIQASEFVEISGRTPDGQFPSALSTTVSRNAIGNGGNVLIETGQLRVSDEATISAATFAEGNAGNISIQAVDSVRLINGDIFTSVEESGIGNAGNITIETQQLHLTDKSQIIAENSGQGNAGNVTIQASDSVQLINGDILSNVTENTTGNAGNITIETPQLQMINGAQVSASTEGKGNGGTITVKAENIDVSGNIVSAEGESFNSGFFAQSDASGNAGTIMIEAERLRVTDGGSISVSADDTGDAGTIIVRANDVELLDGRDSQNSSILDASVKPIRREDSGSGTGSGGSVTVEAERLVLRNGGRIEARTANGTGESGKVTITASESVELSGINSRWQFWR
jgi:large exoprotein involved in heme utilization and adhesion